MKLTGSYKPMYSAKPLRIRLSINQKLIILQSLYQLLGAGIPLADCIAMMVEENKDDRRLCRYLGSIHTGLNSGEPLSQSITRWQHNFDQLTIDLIHSGEQTGQLTIVLGQLIHTLEKQKQCRQSLANALFYPGINLMMGLFVTLFMLLVVLPQFRELYQQLQRQPPPVTQWLLIISDNLVHLRWQTVINTAVICHWLAEIIRLLPLQSISGRLPLWGRALYFNQTRYLLNTCLIYLHAARPLPEALQTLLKRPAVIFLYKKQLRTMYEQLCSGLSLTETINDTRLFPGRVNQLLIIGDKTGELKTMMSQAADYSFQLFEGQLKRLQQWAEPLVLCLLGMLIGGLMVAMYLPLFNLGHAL